MSKVMIHPATYESVRPVVDRAFELFPLKLYGKTVLIKPNVLRASEASEGIVTHPAVLRAVVDKVETMEPVVVGENPGLFSYGANEESFKNRACWKHLRAITKTSATIRSRWIQTFVSFAFAARKSFLRKLLP